MSGLKSFDRKSRSKFPQNFLKTRWSKYGPNSLIPNSDYIYLASGGREITVTYKGLRHDKHIFEGPNGENIELTADKVRSNIS